MKHCPMTHCLIGLALALAASASMASNRLHNPASPDHTLTQQQTPRTVRSLRVKVLSTMLSGNPNGGIGEWGFAAIVEVDGQRILFDTGARPDTVLKNADEKLDWTASELKEFGLRNFLGAHCTGVEAVYRIRRQVGLNRQNCVVGAVGSSFDLDKEIDPLLLAR